LTKLRASPAILAHEPLELFIEFERSNTSMIFESRRVACPLADTVLLLNPRIRIKNVGTVADAVTVTIRMCTAVSFIAIVGAPPATVACMTPVGKFAVKYCAPTCLAAVSWSATVCPTFSDLAVASADASTAADNLALTQYSAAPSMQVPMVGISRNVATKVTMSNVAPRSLALLSATSALSDLNSTNLRFSGRDMLKAYACVL